MYNYLLHILFYFLLIYFVISDTLPPVKNLQGPPEDFQLHQLPSKLPSQVSRGGWFIIVKGLRETIDLPRNDHFYISILLREDAFNREVSQQSETELIHKNFDEPPLFIKITGQALNITYIDQTFEPRKLYSFGYWERNYEVINGDAPATLTMNYNGLVVIQDYDDSYFGISSQSMPYAFESPVIEIQTNCMNEHDLKIGNNIVMTSHLSERSLTSLQRFTEFAHGGLNPEPLVTFSSWIMEITPEKGDTISTYSMQPTKRMFSSKFSDMEFGQEFEGVVSFDQPGSYEIQIKVDGSILLPGNLRRTFTRTSIHTLHVNEKKDLLSLSSSVMALDDLIEKDMMEFYIPIETWFTNPLGKKYKAYAEVWGFNKTLEHNQDNLIGDEENIPSPIAYISGMTFGDLCPDKIEGSSTKICIRLKLSKQWISKAEVSVKSFELHNIFIQDAETSSILAQNDKSSVSVLGTITMGPESEFTGKITERMLMGPRPSNLKYDPNGKSVLVISHGYCSDSVPFKLDDYKNYIAFKDLNQNRNNDAFALKIYDFVTNHPDGPFNRYSFVAHSQGGLASTHLVSFYWTGADNFPPSETPLRIIQSVGSPYRGTAIAGYIATLGRIFGIACGSQFDLQHAGAGLWLTLIPKSVRRLLFYTTTTWDGNYSYCSLPLNSILTYKNDGVCENQFADIDFANPVYHDLKGWCHIDTMRFPSQCTNSDLNKIYNEMAPR